MAGVLSVSRGGARHKEHPIVDVDILSRVFEKHKLCIADFGVYEHVSRTQACRGVGLVLCYDLLKEILLLCPGGDMPGTSAKAAMVGLIVADPSINKTIYNSGVWAGQRCERLGTLLNHLRRIARETDRMKQAAMQLNGTQLTLLKELVQLIKVTGEHSWASGIASGRGGVSDAEETVGYDEDPVTPQPIIKRRMLGKQRSDVSVDDDGYPALLSTGSQPTSDLSRQATSSSVASKKRSSASSAADSQVELDEEGYPTLLLFATGAVPEPAIGPSKKKAKQTQASARPAGGTPAAEESRADGAIKKWTTMWYKASSAVGVRRSAGHTGEDAKKQIFSLRHPDFTKEELTELGKECIELLKDGEDDDTVRQWAFDEMDRRGIAKHRK